ncbi:hypothetical protein U2P90_19110 (plasmid) [Deinococcus sp. AB2017081]|nr:hypothetical protein [Deinococcus sp. AB2017081]WQE97183.1 hypothetical protein U2P90_19110 [Deinococcus sp. AB2017081]
MPQMFGDVLKLEPGAHQARAGGVAQRVQAPVRHTDADTQRPEPVPRRFRRAADDEVCALAAELAEVTDEETRQQDTAGLAALAVEGSGNLTSVGW